MRIVGSRNSFELHVSSSLFDNNVVVGGKCYNYKRLVIPKVIMDYFLENNPELTYIYFYFVDDSIFISVERLHGLKYSKRKVMKISGKNSYFVNLSLKSFEKVGVDVGDNVLFVIGRDCLKSSDKVGIELVFE